MARLGVDVGGTNTDLMLETFAGDPVGAGIFQHKVPSTQDDQSEGVVRGIVELCDKAGIACADIKRIVHGTTVATNAALEHHGANVGMLTTRGFRDILHIGRHKRPHNFSLHFDVPWQTRPLVRRRNRLPVTERILPPDGRIVTPLDEAEVRAAAQRLRDNGVEAVVVCFLFSFLNDAHERRAQEIVREVLPEIYVWRSSEVADVMREFERFSTTAMNAFIGPKTAHYLGRLESRLHEHGIDADLRIMQSNGGLATIDQCLDRPVNILMSGPAGGVIGGRHFADMVGEDNILSVDIGGTSADISALSGGELRIKNSRDATVADHPVMTPIIDMVTIGAGGGSIAYIDPAGGFNVGPRSAGAEPGPACYGRGGAEPTVTDANVVLGRLDADRMLGGDLGATAELAEQAIRDKVAEPLGLDVTDAALGILKVVNNNMALAIRSASVARGLDPREFALMPFGGAGPVHGPALAAEVGAKCVLVPPAPGITAAAGLLATDMKYEVTRSLLYDLNTADAGELSAVDEALNALENECRDRLRADHIAADDIQVQHIAECRYHGQGFELRIDMPGRSLDASNVQTLIERFHDRHENDYGYRFAGSIVELVTLRVVGRGHCAKLNWPPLPAATDGADPTGALLYKRETVFDDGRRLTTPRYDRIRLSAGHVIAGPAIIVQHDSTSLIPPGWRAAVTEHGNIRISEHTMPAADAVEPRAEEIAS